MNMTMAGPPREATEARPSFKVLLRRSPPNDLLGCDAQRVDHKLAFSGRSHTFNR